MEKERRRFSFHSFRGVDSFHFSDSLNVLLLLDSVDSQDLEHSLDWLDWLHSVDLGDSVPSTFWMERKRSFLNRTLNRAIDRCY